MKDVVKSIQAMSNEADKFHQSSDERDAVLNERHETDMKSDNWLSKSIRPMTLIVLLLIQVCIVVLSAFGKHVDETIVIQHGVLLSGAFGFYFNSKKAERIAQKNAEANIKIEKIKARENRRENRHERREERREERKSK